MTLGMGIAPANLRTQVPENGCKVSHYRRQERNIIHKIGQQGHDRTQRGQKTIAKLGKYAEVL